VIERESGFGFPEEPVFERARPQKRAPFFQQTISQRGHKTRAVYFATQIATLERDPATRRPAFSRHAQNEIKRDEREMCLKLPLLKA
jgi:hypothetical protein